MPDLTTETPILEDQGATLQGYQGRAATLITVVGGGEPCPEVEAQPPPA